MEELINDLDNLQISEPADERATAAATKIQRWFRDITHKRNTLPVILRDVQQYLVGIDIIFQNPDKDGRINSSTHEAHIINLIKEQFPNKVTIPKIRMWYDVLLHDDTHGKIPVNIKTTTTKTPDNIGNITPCVWAYTDTNLNLTTSYKSGDMSKVLIEKLKAKQFNMILKRDYYFLVVNKTNTKDIIINSLKGLTTLTPNANNLPFQVRWDRNSTFRYFPIGEVVKKFITCIIQPRPSWQETFMTEMRLIIP